MATAYRYTGTDARDYPTLGFHVEPGDVLYLDGKAPDSVFVPVEDVPLHAGSDEPEPAADWRRDAFPTSEPRRRPNKAAPQADWVEYAKAEGSFEATTGQAPADATRKAIVDHYYSADAEPDEDVEPEPAAVPPTARPVPMPVVPSPAAPADDDAPKEV